jgi:hypothetical protein
LGLGACPSLVLAKVSKGSRPSRSEFKIRGGLSLFIIEKKHIISFCPHAIGFRCITRMRFI